MQVQTQGLLTAKELASYLGVSPCTVYRWVKRGTIPLVRRPGLGIRFRKEEIDEWLAQGASKPSPLKWTALDIDLQLESYDRLFLKGVKMAPKGKTWNYPFGSVYLRPSVSGKDHWHIYYRVGKKRVRQAVKGAKSRADALMVLQTVTTESFRESYGFKKEKQVMTFKEIAELFLAHTKQKKSWKDDKYRLDATLIPYFGSYRLDEITPRLVEDFRTKRLTKVKPPTTNRELAVLKTIFNRAINYGYATLNPVKKVKFLSEADTLKERILSPEEENRLLEVAAPHLRSVILVALHTGMRKGEILNLKWDNVDLASRIIHVVKTKSGKNRIVPINETLYQELYALKSQGQGDSSVFPYKGVQVSFETARKKAAVEGLRFHDLRHTFATRLVHGGVDLITVQKLLGHSTVLVTQRYTHSYEEQMRDAVKVLGRRPQRRIPVAPEDVPSAMESPN